jgi:YggT family protein
MNGYLTNPLAFVITTLFSLYIMAVMLRFLLQRVRADFYNPISQFIVRVTNPPLKPLRRLIPGLGGVDVASLVLMLALQMLSLTIIVLLRGVSVGFGTLLLLSVTELVDLAFNIFIFSILIQAILSWVNPGTYNPVSAILGSLTEPVLRPVRRLLPPMGGLDLSPLFAILGLQVLKMLVMPLLTGLAGG